MKLGIIGCGAIGSDVAQAADSFPEISNIYLFDIESKAQEKLHASLKKSTILPIDKLIKNADIVFEAASQKAVFDYGKNILEHAKDLIIMSIGSLFDDDFRCCHILLLKKQVDM